MANQSLSLGVNGKNAIGNTICYEGTHLLKVAITEVDGSVPVYLGVGGNLKESGEQAGLCSYYQTIAGHTVYKQFCINVDKPLVKHDQQKP